MVDSKTKILIVDDMITQRKLLAKMLKELGFSEITEAKDGVDAWAKISNAEPPFGLVITDCDMPNCSGVDLLKRTKADSRFANLPFVLMFMETEKKEIMESVVAGGKNFVTKPIKQDSLAEKIKQALNE